MPKWQCLECGTLFELEDKYVFGYCPACSGGLTRQIGVEHLTAIQKEHLLEICGPSVAYDIATAIEKRRLNNAKTTST